MDPCPGHVFLDVSVHVFFDVFLNEFLGVFIDVFQDMSCRGDWHPDNTARPTGRGVAGVVSDGALPGRCCDVDEEFILSTWNVRKCRSPTGANTSISSCWSKYISSYWSQHEHLVLREPTRASRPTGANTSISSYGSQHEHLVLLEPTRASRPTGANTSISSYGSQHEHLVLLEPTRASRPTGANTSISPGLPGNDTTFLVCIYKAGLQNLELVRTVCVFQSEPRSVPRKLGGGDRGNRAEVAPGAAPRDAVSSFRKSLEWFGRRAARL
ncbi:unnamed protein product [Boreogadus saida]